MEKLGHTVLNVEIEDYDNLGFRVSYRENGHDGPIIRDIHIPICDPDSSLFKAFEDFIAEIRNYRQGDAVWTHSVLPGDAVWHQQPDGTYVACDSEGTPL